MAFILHDPQKWISNFFEKICRAIDFFSRLIQENSLLMEC
jgi:hypothetical protein